SYLVDPRATACFNEQTASQTRVTSFIVSFDVYGTLVDVRGGSRDAFAAILRTAGAPQLDVLEFWEHWEAANIRRYWPPYRPYREICGPRWRKRFDTSPCAAIPISSLTTSTHFRASGALPTSTSRSIGSAVVCGSRPCRPSTTP